MIACGAEPEMAKMIVEALNWCDATLLVAPVNDAPANTSPGGGSHWCTLLIEKPAAYYCVVTVSRHYTQLCLDITLNSV